MPKQEHAKVDGSLLFFGIRRTEIAPGFGLHELTEEISIEGIGAFINDTEGRKTRSTILSSVLSEFLRDQKPANVFRYLIHNSEMFDRRLKEGLAIYLAEHSPEKLTEQARKAGLAFSEKLEKIIGGLKAKSLSILFGGAIVSLLVDDADLHQVRPTQDVDTLVQVITQSEYAELEQRLRDNGFRNDLSEGVPICRYLMAGCKVDVMPISAAARYLLMG